MKALGGFLVLFVGNRFLLSGSEVGELGLLDGNYQHRLDDKGRLTVPSEFRYELGRRFYITRGHDQCLYVLKEEHYKALSATITRAVLTSVLPRDGSRYEDMGPLVMDPFERSSDPLISVRAMFNDYVRVLQRHFFGDSFEVNLDNQGRIFIPESLRRYAGIDKDVVIVGVGDRLELWSPEKWDEEMASSVEKLRLAIEGMGLHR